MPILISVPGIPVAKGRPRMTRTGHAYTPEKTRAYESKLAWYGAKAMGPHLPLEGPLSVTLKILLTVPQSWSARKREKALNGDISPVGRPDLDNYIKALDALNGIAWKDDSQICRIEACKMYGRLSGLHIVIEPLEIVREG